MGVAFNRNGRVIEFNELIGNGAALCVPRPPEPLLGRRCNQPSRRTSKERATRLPQGLLTT